MSFQVLAKGLALVLGQKGEVNNSFQVRCSSGAASATSSWYFKGLRLCQKEALTGCPLRGLAGPEEGAPSAASRKLSLALGVAPRTFHGDQFLDLFNWSPAGGHSSHLIRKYWEQKWQEMQTKGIKNFPTRFTISNREESSELLWGTVLELE